MKQDRLYSIGYANKPIATFIGQLKQYNIDAIADVRSVPYSKAFYDYHQEALIETLKQAKIRYVYLGNELGPRSKDEKHYDENNQVQFDRLMQSELYLEGIKRIQIGLQKGLRIALMCAEKDPADCHRSLLIAYHMKRAYEVDIQHILHDGSLELQSAMESRLTDMHNRAGDLFSSGEEQTYLAYMQQTQLKAYRKPK